MNQLHFQSLSYVPKTKNGGPNGMRPLSMQDIKNLRKDAPPPSWITLHDQIQCLRCAQWVDEGARVKLVKRGILCQNCYRDTAV